MSFSDRLGRLRQRKLDQTLSKREKHGSIDGDDNGFVLPPDGFRWTPEPNHSNGCFYGPEGWGANFRRMMEAHPTYIDPDDAMAGRLMLCLYSYDARHWPSHCSYDHLKPEQKLYGIISGIGGPHHFAPDLEWGLKLGWGGILDWIRTFRNEHGLEKISFFDAEENIVLGMTDYIKRNIEAAYQALESETDPELRSNLRDMAECNAWIMTNPPRTFREACQWIVTMNQCTRAYNGNGAGGCLDRLLWPYYVRDKQEGILNDEEAVFFLACLLLNDTIYYQLGGPDAEGNDATNQLSYLILEAAHQIGIACNLTVRVHEKMDQEFFRIAVRYLVTDRQGWPRFCGDKGLTDGFMRNGFSMELARSRISVGCHWMVIPGREYTLNDVVKINVAKTMEVAFWEMMEESDTPSVAQLWDRFSNHLHKAVLCVARGLDIHLNHQHEVMPELAIDLLCHGTLEQGLDASNGGVEFYNMCVDGSGLATAADSFAAMEQRIESEGVLSWGELARQLKTNFDEPDGERIRLMLSRSDRFCGDGTLGNTWARRVSELFTQVVKAHPTPEGRNMIPGWFSWANTIGMGSVMGATPNGRKAGRPISHGANPDPGFRRDAAPTAMAIGIAAIQPGWGNTAPMQLEIDPGALTGDRAVDLVSSLILTHFDLGGTLFNVNVLSREKILEANEDPTRYPDLVVRVTGFTAYFASLSPEFRRLVVDRMLTVV